MSALLHGTITTEQAATYLGLHTQTLKRYRSQKIGPDYLRIGNIIRYKEVDLDAWVLKSSRREET